MKVISRNQACAGMWLARTWFNEPFCMYICHIDRVGNISTACWSCFSATTVIPLDYLKQLKSSILGKKLLVHNLMCMDFRIYEKTLTVAPAQCFGIFGRINPSPNFYFSFNSNV